MNWNNNFVYAIGLFTADGCLSKDKRHLEFCSKDKEQVELFKKCFHLTNSITGKSRGGSSEKKYHHIQFGNVKLYKFLQSIGLSTRKSLILKELRIPKKFIFDFIRGYLDGDGSIQSYCFHPDSKQSQVKIRFYSGSYQFLKWLHEKIKENIDVLGGKIKQVKRCWVLAYGKGDTIQILKVIYYKGALSLKRKLNRAKRILKSHPNYNRLKWGNRYTMCGRSQIGRGASLRN